MTDELKDGTSGAAEIRGKAELFNEVALNKIDTDHRVEFLLSELQVQQAELEMQNHELREAQQALEETRDRYAMLYDFAPVGYLTLDDAGGIVEINLTGAAMLGQERANLVGKPFSGCLAHGDNYAFFYHLRQTFQSLGNIVTELRIKTRSGEVSHIRLESAVVLNDAKVCRTVITNITEQKRVALELQQARTEREALLSAIPAVVFFMDMNLRYVAVSQAMAELLGRTPDDVLGKTDFELFPPHLAEDFQRIGRQVLDSGRSKSGIEERLKDTRGQKMCLSTVLAPFYAPSGGVAGLLGVGIDITALKKAANANQELILQNRLLTQNLFSIQESQRRHLARELHDELGQWLTAISVEAQAIESAPGKQDRVAESAQAIRVSANKMHKVIRNMLRQLRPALLDELGLADSLRELVNQWQAHHRDVACELKLEGNPDGFVELTNITAYRIIQEALSNISKYAQADKVWVQVRREPGETPDLDVLALSVEDNGKGFDPDSVSGGLGLLGMRERAIAVNGEFTLSNTPGRGVRIDVRLPVNFHLERRKK